MISYMKGLLVEKGSEGIVLEVGGIGYELAMSSASLAALPAAGAVAQVWTYLQVKEDGLSLYGFSGAAERDMFERLIGVSGVGAKMAISALSTMSAAELGSAIAQSDVARISTVPGIGKKTAQRIVLELQGVLASLSPSQLAFGASAAGSAIADASEALLGMGFSPQEAAAALEGCAEQDAPSAVRYALRNMGGA